MIREICKAEVFLAQKAEAATADDLNTAQDLLDTLIAHKDGCVGMAANMIGVNKRIIAFENDGEYMLMFNPVIVKKSGPYDTEEGCLSLTPAGEYFYRKSLLLTADCDRMCAEAAKIAKGEAANLKIGYLRTYAGGRVPPRSRPFRRGIPTSASPSHTAAMGSCVIC